MELCKLYIEQNSEITAEGFLEWIANNENATFRLTSNLLLTFALAIYVQKIGVRSNDMQMIEAGRMKFMPMFYGFHHLPRDRIHRSIKHSFLSKRNKRSVQTKTYHSPHLTLHIITKEEISVLKTR